MVPAWGTRREPDAAGGADVRLLVVLCLSLATTPLYGLVLRSLWQWFVVPLGVLPIGVAHAIGLTVVAAMFRTHAASSTDDEENSPVVGVLSSAVVAVALWGIGWCVHALMVAP